MKSVFHAIGRHVPFADLLGITVAEHAPGRARLELELRPELMNSWKVAHGGVVMTLADIALGVAVLTLARGAHGAMTIELKVSFLGPAKGRLAAEGRCLKAGKSLAFCEGEVLDGEGNVVAKALGTYRVRRGEGPGDAVDPGPAKLTP